MIPRIIHQIWIGDLPVPRKWMDSWVQFCEDYDWEYRLWTEDNITVRNQKAYDYYYQKKKYFGAADVLRIEILHDHGGWFFDADSELLDPEAFVTHPMQEARMVACIGLPVGSVTNRVQNGAIGAEAGHPALANYIDLVPSLGLEPAWNTVGGTGLTRAIQRAGWDTVTTVPMCTFYPEVKGKLIPVEGPIVSRHHWGSTYKKYA